MKWILRYLLCGLLALCSCSKSKMPPPPSPEQIPYSSDIPTFTFVVQPIKFTAAIPQLLHTHLCYRSLMASPPTSASEQARRIVDCGGEQQCIYIPAHEGKTEESEYLMVGEQIFPGFGPQELRAQLITALSGIKNLKVVENEMFKEGNSRPSSPSSTTRGPYLLRAVLSEMSASADKSAAGVTGSGLGIGLITALVSRGTTKKTGYVRFDLGIVDLSSSRIVAAFPVGGSFSDSYVSETFFQGVISEKEDFQSNILEWATRAALNEAAREVYERLKGQV